MYKIVVLLFLITVQSVYSVNILFATYLPSPSHHIWNRALALGLVSKGHNVTFISPDEDDIVKPANYTHIIFDGLYESMSEEENADALVLMSPLDLLLGIQEFGSQFCETFSKSKNLQTLLNYPENSFDLIIFDVTGGTCLYALIHKFNYPPVVGVTPFLLPTYVAYDFGNHLYPSYVPWWGLPLTTEMTFTDRISNFLYSYLEQGLRHARQLPAENHWAKIIFGDEVPSIQELQRNFSLILSNTDPLLDLAQPLAPNFIPVGGLHTRSARKLPQDLQTVLDKSDGVIIFSLGTNIRSDKLDGNVQKALLDAFSKLKETIIWKFESDIEDLPKNVIVRKWLPQNDVLGHPKTKLFIGHGGALSTQEAMYHGVPMISVPFFMDQYLNTKNIVNRKLGITLNFKNITSESVLDKLKEVLGNPIYAENMRKLSDSFKDRKETPLERGIFWIEYVLRNGGAPFLSTPARDLPFYVSSSLDVIVFLVVVATIVLVLSKKLIKLVFRVAQKNKTKIKQN